MRLDHNRHTSFDFSGGPLSISTRTGKVTDFSGWTGESQVRDRKGKLIANLTFEWLDAAGGMLRVRAANGTKNWPLDILVMDIRLTSPSGETVATSPQEINVYEGPTR